MSALELGQKQDASACPVSPRKRLEVAAFRQPASAVPTPWILQSA
jgi:hypothetical protein